MFIVCLLGISRKKIVSENGSVLQNIFFIKTRQVPLRHHLFIILLDTSGHFESVAKLAKTDLTSKKSKEIVMLIHAFDKNKSFNTPLQFIDCTRNLYAHRGITQTPLLILHRIQFYCNSSSIVILLHCINKTNFSKNVKQNRG